MASYIIRRLVTSIFVVVGVSAVVFCLTFLSGDPAVLMMPPNSTAEEIRAFREQQGYDDPILVQYARYMQRAVQGDFGDSIIHGQAALPLIVNRLPATLELTVASMILAICLAIPLGVFSALRRGTIFDLGGMLVALIGQSVPSFWLAIMMIYLFSVTWGLLPTSGRGGLTHLILPAIAIAVGLMALLTRLVRSTMLEVLGEDYIRTARAKGIREMLVVSRHALRNALIPLVTVIGLQFGYILGSAVVVETVFTWPGVGLFTIQAITNRDYPVVQASVFVLATAVVMINLIVDLVYGFLDPRIRVGTN
ncbi:MAG: ABC transporter permease [Thermomicrobiales bacterium]|nr:ABC transporter permease [Thermomicrobiales bacterium]